MIVRLINARDVAQLTMGKDYNVIRQLHDFYLIRNDKGFELWYSKKRFKIMEV